MNMASNRWVFNVQRIKSFESVHSFVPKLFRATGKVIAKLETYQNDSTIKIRTL